MISVRTRCTVVLIIFGEYAYGDHVTDVHAMQMRCSALFRRRVSTVYQEGDDPRIQRVPF